MAFTIMITHGGREDGAKFVMKEVKSYSSAEAQSPEPVVSVMFGPKTGNSILQKSLLYLEPRLPAILGHRIHSGIPLKQLHQRNNSQCLKPVFCLSCANNKEKKHSILYI